MHLSVDGHLGCFHALVIVNHAAMNTEVHEPGASYAEEEKNKEEKKQVLHINAYTCNLEKQYW